MGGLGGEGEEKGERIKKQEKDKGKMERERETMRRRRLIYYLVEKYL